MPIPFRDLDDLNELGPAAFLKVARGSDGIACYGALFLVNARGEPLEFTFNRAEAPSSPLWRSSDISRQLERSLAISLLSICPRLPTLLLCLAEEVSGELFCREIRLSLPVCRVATSLQTAPYLAEERRDLVEASEPMHLFWFPDRPPESSMEARLMGELVARGLLLEPFDRALSGLREVYGPFDRRESPT
jgi:hypothetical protein